MAAPERPIFIVGCPRSGTGILYQMLRLHPSIGWITPFSNWICGKQWFRQVPPSIAWKVEFLIHRIPDALLPTFLKGPHDGSLGLSSVYETHEGHSIWYRVFPNPPNHLATEEDATPEVRSYLRDVLQWHLHYHDSTRLLWKTPRNAFRLRFLHAVFPEAYVIHLVRDGRAVSNSILKRRRQDYGRLDKWWGVRPPGWETVLSDAPVKQAAWTWTQSLQQVRSDASIFGDKQFLELTYESFTSNPESELRRLFSFVGIDPEEFFMSDQSSQIDQIYSPKASWKNQLKKEQKKFLESILQDELQRYGYNINKTYSL